MMTPDQVREVATVAAKVAAKEAVTDILEKLGVDTSDPHEARADFIYLRSWRETVQAVRRQAFLTTVGILVTGIVGLVWLSVGKH